jgi:hypothetical protein
VNPRDLIRASFYQGIGTGIGVAVAGALLTIFARVMSLI